MSDLFNTEEFLLASDNQFGDVWAHHYIDGAYPEAIEDWLGVRKFFYDAYVAYREKQCAGDQRFRVPATIPAGSEAYRQCVLDALGAGHVVLDSKWIFNEACVRVAALEKTNNEIAATVVRSSKIYSRSGTTHDPLERGLVALALEANCIAPVTVSSTRMLITEGSDGFTHSFKPPQQVGAQSEESVVRAELAKLGSVLADAMRPPETGEYCAIFDDAGLGSADALCKKVAARTGADWRRLNAAQKAVVNRLVRSLQDNTVQMSEEFGKIHSFLCFSVDVMPVRSTLLNPANGQGQMTVTPRALAVAWDVNGKIEKMFFSLNDLCADSGKIGELKDKAGPFDQRASFVDCGNVHGASRIHQWFRRRFGIEHAKGIDSMYTNRHGIVHPELVRNGFTLESWSKAFLGKEIRSLSSHFPLEQRLKIWAGEEQGDALVRLDGILCSRAELFVRGMLAAKKLLAKCRKGLTGDLQNPEFYEMPVPAPVSGGKRKRVESPKGTDELLLL